MLKKLRMKFVAIIMASVAVVLAIVFTGICVSEYQRSMSSVEMALSSSIDRASTVNSHLDLFMFGEEPFSDAFGDASDGDRRFIENGVDPRESNGARENGNAQGQMMGPQIGGQREQERSLVPVAVYLLESDGSLTVASNFTTASIDDDVLTSASSLIANASEGSGELASLGLVYQKRVTETGTFVAFADSAYASSWQSLAITLVIAGLLTLAVFFVIALMLSRWALRPVEEAWSQQRQFVADASHELKTPLTVVLANTSILLKHPEASIASQSQWIESTQVEAESMQGLVNEMLELAHVESRVNLQHAPLDFSDMVDMQTLQFESVAFERGCRFEESIAEGIKMNGDETRLRKMTSTLIENALKYVDDGGLVEVRLSATPSTATLAIHNTGSTISPEDLPHIFDRFYRTDKARTSGAGGFGLGLAIAREIAREHDGDITCTSDAAGTTFTVTLPTLHS